MGSVPGFRVLWETHNIVTEYNKPTPSAEKLNRANKMIEVIKVTFFCKRQKFRKWKILFGRKIRFSYMYAYKENILPFKK